MKIRFVPPYPRGYWCTEDRWCSERDHSVNCPMWRGPIIHPAPSTTGQENER